MLSADILPSLELPWGEGGLLSAGKLWRHGHLAGPGSLLEADNLPSSSIPSVFRAWRLDIACHPLPYRRCSAHDVWAGGLLAAEIRPSFEPPWGAGGSLAAEILPSLEIPWGPGVLLSADILPSLEPPWGAGGLLSADIACGLRSWNTKVFQIACGFHALRRYPASP